MSLICPTVTVITPDPDEYKAQLEVASSLSSRIQIDLMDGDFAPTKSVNLAQVWWPDGVQADVHLMYRHPAEQLESLVSLKPSLVIIHAEADGDLAGTIKHLKKFSIKTGLALLKPTQPNDVAELIKLVDHVLIFSGDLGKFGGQADMAMLAKVTETKVINPNVEVGWDGGASLDNVKQLADGGVDVINVGGAIQRAEQPLDAYAKLVSETGRQTI